MRSKWTPVVIVLLMSMLSCNLGEIAGKETPTTMPTRTPPPITPSGTELAARAVGEYFCSGHEVGMLAAAAFLTLTEEGQVIDVPAPGLGGERTTGSWRYQPGENRIEFEGELGYSSGSFSAGSSRLVIHLDEGVERVHVEEGVMTCEPR